MVKTDFGFKLRLNEKPTFALVEWMKQDLLVELWETRPKLTEKRNEETQEIVKEVVNNAHTNTPIIEKKRRGVRTISPVIFINLGFEDQPE